MKRLLYLLLMAGILVGFVLAVGCSDDDDKGPTPLTPGDPDDPQFNIVAGVIGEGLFNNDGAIIDLAMELIDSIPTKSGYHSPFQPQTPGQFDSLAYYYSYNNYWHIFSIWARETNWSGDGFDTLIYIGMDSLRFGNASGPMQYPDSTTNTLNIRAHIDVTVSTFNGEAMIKTDARYDITGQPDVSLVINGTSADTLEAFMIGDTMACEVGLVANQTATNLYIDEALEGCPRSGTMRIVSSLDIYCEGETDSIDASGTWTVLFTFNDGMVTININNGTNYWTETDQCGPVESKKADWSTILNNLTETLRQK